jgi:putative thiamine transport system ATP-binding protein
MSLCVDVHHLRAGITDLVHSLHLQVQPGQIHTVMGDSGSGKSTLLSAVCGTLLDGVAFEGTVTLHGRRIDTLPTAQRRVGILFQDDLLFAHMTVLENLLFAVPAQVPEGGASRAAQQAARLARARQALADVELAQLANADPATLSGGQRVRVALMRALLAEPQALLLDEPFSKLDTALRTRVREFVFGTIRARGLPTLLVTHDAADVADAAQLTQLRAPSSPQPYC